MGRRGGAVAWTGWSSRSGSCIKRVERTQEEEGKEVGTREELMGEEIL